MNLLERKHVHPGMSRCNVNGIIFTYNTRLVTTVHSGRRCPDQPLGFGQLNGVLQFLMESQCFFLTSARRNGHTPNIRFPIKPALPRHTLRPSPIVDTHTKQFQRTSGVVVSSRSQHFMPSIPHHFCDPRAYTPCPQNRHLQWFFFHHMQILKTRWHKDCDCA